VTGRMHTDGEPALVGRNQVFDPSLFPDVDFVESPTAEAVGIVGLSDYLSPRSSRGIEVGRVHNPVSQHRTFSGLRHRRRISAEHLSVGLHHLCLEASPQLSTPSLGQDDQGQSKVQQMPRCCDAHGEQLGPASR